MLSSTVCKRGYVQYSESTWARCEITRWRRGTKLYGEAEEGAVDVYVRVGLELGQSNARIEGTSSSLAKVKVKANPVFAFLFAISATEVNKVR